MLFLSRLTSALLLLSASLTSAARLIVSIPPSPQLLNPSSLPASTHAILLGPPGTRYDALLRKDNTFLFPSIEPANYLFTIHSVHFQFPPLRIDVNTSITDGDGVRKQGMAAWQTFRGNEWNNRGPEYGASEDGSLEITVKVLGQREFYQQRGGFSIMAFLKSPMILMGLFSLIMIFGMPYLMEQMDEETKKEFEEIQKSQPITGEGGAASQSWMAGKTSGSNAASSGASTGGGNAKKR